MAMNYIMFGFLQKLILIALRPNIHPIYDNYDNLSQVFTIMIDRSALKASARLFPLGSQSKRGLLRAAFPS